MVSFTTKFVGLIAATALAVGLAGAAPAATLSLRAPPAAFAGTTKTAASGGGLRNSGTHLALPAVPATMIGDGPGVDAFVFSATASAFEYGKAGVAAVPVPAAGLLLLTAVGAVSALRRRTSA